MPDYFPFRIARKRQLTPSVIGWHLKPPTEPIFQYRPGQFVMVGLYDAAGALSQKKAYSICTIPQITDHLEIAFKIHGDFTQAMSKLEEGDTVAIAGPFGVFTLPEPIDQGLLFLGGGIGITPLYSMIRSACRLGATQAITLLYAVRNPEELAFREELKDLASRHQNLQVVCFAETSEQWDGECGRISGEKIDHYVPSVNQRRCYVCGPVPFMASMVELLKERGVPPDRIKQEKF